MKPINTLRSHILQPLELFLSRGIVTDELKSVCLTLGPYRNLTTLTAGILALHPACQVLNHGGERIFGSGRLDFLTPYSEKIFSRFVRYAAYISGGGKRGDYGGSVTRSHAFTHDIMKERYTQRYGNRLRKERIHCLYWKESLRTANIIRNNNVDLEKLLNENPLLRFLMPVRNPLDCARSNIRTNKAGLFPCLVQESPFEDVLAAVLDEFAWFLSLKKKNPGRFFYFYQHTFDESVLRNLAVFLGIKPDSRWMRDAMDVYTMRRSYEYDPGVTELYHKLVKDKFGSHPGVRKQLIAFIKEQERQFSK